MNYGEIKTCDIANGPGVRVTLFVSGCTHHCKGCFNAETWDFQYGKPFTEETEKELLTALSPAYIQGLTLLGGEPFEPSNQISLLPFLKLVREIFPDKNIWCYTGYTLETDLQPGGQAFCEYTKEMLGLLDVLVDGEFVESQKDIRLVFRGSSNQQIIDLKESKKQQKIVLLNI